MNTSPAELAGKVRAVLEQAGVTQVAASVVLGIEQPAVSKRYRGKTPWRAHELQLLADRYDIPVARFYATAEPAGRAS